MVTGPEQDGESLGAGLAWPWGSHLHSPSLSFLWLWCGLLSKLWKKKSELSSSWNVPSDDLIRMVSHYKLCRPSPHLLRKAQSLTKTLLCASARRCVCVCEVLKVPPGKPRKQQNLVLFIRSEQTWAPRTIKKCEDVRTFLGFLWKLWARRSKNKFILFLLFTQSPKKIKMFISL